jgi:pimeloyl-ACP methyl ester carboxylesterase
MLLFHPGLLRIEEQLEPRGLVNDIVIVPNLIRQHQYSLLTDYLNESLGYEDGDDQLEFGYDFRQDNRESAMRLAAAIDKWDVKGPITIIAHSMGCLVARCYIELLGGRKKVERVVLLGGPHLGTPYAFAMLLKRPRPAPGLECSSARCSCRLSILVSNPANVPVCIRPASESPGVIRGFMVGRPTSAALEAGSRVPS